MNHQPISVWLSLVFVVACGGGDGGDGDGELIDLRDGTPYTPDQTPRNADQPPPAPPESLVGGSSPGGGGGGNNGGPCGMACAQAIERGCQITQDSCVAQCNNPSDTDVCLAEQRALVVCGLHTYCPGDTDVDLPGTCPAEYSAFLTCAGANQ